jgi:hypothetical protein
VRAPLLLLLAGSALAGPALAQAAPTSLTWAWSPEQPLPNFVLDQPLNLTYTWAAPGLALGSTSIALDAHAGEIGLNATLANATLSAPVQPPAGQDVLATSVRLKWVLPPSNGQSVTLLLHAHADANGALAPADANATMVVRYPPPAAPPPTAPAPAPPARTPGPPVAFALAALAVASVARRPHGFRAAAS